MKIKFKKTNNKDVKTVKHNLLDSEELLVDKNYFRFFEVLAYCFIFGICVIVFTAYLISSERPDIKFFTVNSTGKIQQIKPVGNDSNLINSGTVQEFVINAIPNAFTFDFNNYKYVIKNQFPRYFSKSAAEELKEYITNNYLEDLLSKKQFLNVSVVNSFIQEQAIENGKHVNKWRLQVPALVNTYNGRSALSKRVKLQLVVEYTGTKANESGLDITNITMTDDRG